MTIIATPSINAASRARPGRRAATIHRLAPTRTNFLVTGGAGFIGSAVCRHLVNVPGAHVVNVDKLTYAGNLDSLNCLQNAPNYRFHRTDICEEQTILSLLRENEIDVILHLAAESHVDRSIDRPGDFIRTNVVGTFHLLNAALTYWRGLPEAKAKGFRFHHVSTDEVFGDLDPGGGLFSETTPYAPRSPYSATKAASDHLVRAWRHTFGLPVVLSNCSNNYGPYHFPEKLIPLVVLNALDERPLPVYGTGGNIRDWLYVEDHARALHLIATQGRTGESYNVGGGNERTNLQVVHAICDILDQRRPRGGRKSYRDLIVFVTDRPGHDRRYAIDSTKLVTELGWSASASFEEGLARTVDWYIDNPWWWKPIRENTYGGDRLGEARAVSG